MGQEMESFSRSGTLIDLVNDTLFPGTVRVEKGKIVDITRDKSAKSPLYLLPGFVDAHVHIESSMLIPSEFARLASVHGTVATVSDPHEIGNVLGVPGVRYMIENAKQVPFYFYFGAPSCVPATSFETAGAAITAQEIEQLFREEGLKYLSEMMNFPGVLSDDPEVWAKLKVAKAFHKPIDGHAPGLRGEAAEGYAAAGISTDHECFTLEEALEKVALGMHILIREGSAAKNYEALHPLIAKYPERLMFCCDDKHPHELVEGHINAFVKRSLFQHNYKLMDVLRIASLNPIRHYQLEVGLLQVGDAADFIAIDHPEKFQVLETYVRGKLIAKNGKTEIKRVAAATPNRFHARPKQVQDFASEATSSKIHVIQAEEGQLITHDKIAFAKVSDHRDMPDLSQDILKLTVVNRYQDAKPAVAFVQNFGLKEGAIASCIAHDSHNMIAVGCSDEAICAAINLLIEHRGGIAVVQGDRREILPLPVAGIMSHEDGYVVAKQYAHMDVRAKELGSSLSAPFMTLSFMALLVIPELKLSDKGLFDGEHFTLIPLHIHRKK